MARLRILFAFCALIAIATPSTVHRTSVEMLRRAVPLKVSFCKSLGYSKTSEINFMRQTNQSVIEQDGYFKALKVLSSSGCSEFLQLYACAVYAPEFVKPNGAFPPCPSLCTRAEQRCRRVSLLLESLIFRGRCRRTRKGENYRGTISMTSSGLPCQAWSSQFPHSHSMHPETHPEDDLTSNYCRNPNGDPNGPWCYTSSIDKKFDYCDVPICKAQFYCDWFPEPSAKHSCIDYQYNEELGTMDIEVKGESKTPFFNFEIPQF